MFVLRFWAAILEFFGHIEISNILDSSLVWYHFNTNIQETKISTYYTTL